MNRWWIQLARYARPQARGLVLILVLLITGTGLALLMPWPLKLIVDNVLAGKPLPPAVAWIAALPGARTPPGLLAWLAAATVGIFLAIRIVGVTRSYIEAGVGSRMTYGLATDLFDRLQRYSLRFHHKQRTGDLVKRITSDTDCVRMLVMNVGVPTATSLVTLVGMFLIMWQLSRGLALFAVALCIPLAWIVKRLAKPMAERRYREQQLQGEIYSLSEQMLSAIPIVQAFGREQCEHTRFRGLAGETVQAQLRAELTGHQFQVSSGAVTAAAAATVMAFGGFAVLQGDLSVGTLLIFISYFAALYSPIETLVYLSEGLSHAGAGARRVFEIFTAEGDSIRDLPNALLLYSGIKPRGMSVRFENVTFGFEPDRPVLHNLSLNIEPGQTVAIMGPTGAGKSTLVSLIPRLFDPWQGAVYVNGLDVRQVSLFSLRENIAVVPQEPFLLPLTVAENIAYGRPGASRHEIIAAAQAASASDFIEQLPSGYETVLGERGVTLSMGQRQRLSIARALLKDAPILLLDEFTSALDAQTEANVIEDIWRLFEGRTVFVVAHRTSTISRARQAIVLEQGTIVDSRVKIPGVGDRLHQHDPPECDHPTNPSTVNSCV